ncbi:MAG: hypothetical protein WAX79_05880, partial [Candidatus Omnitrophota bacterium]
FTVQRNAGEGEVSGIKFIFSNETGTETRTENIILKELEPKRFTFHLGMNVSGITKISIAPIFSSNGKESIGNVVASYDVKTGVSFKAQNSSCDPAVNPCGSAVCGTATNGTCGTISCGTCSTGTCNSTGQCVAGCAPATCASLGYNCGTWNNGTCAGTLSCGIYGNGSCQTGFNCVGGSCVAQTSNNCGNGVVDPGEACDGTNVNGYTCATVAAGFVSGTLSCSSDCKRYITTSCVAGDVHTAADCSQAAVQVAITSASDGDTVQVPEGSCTWTSGITINKRIILRGAGKTITVITSNMPNGLINLGLSGSRITQLGVILQNTNGMGIVAEGTNWRVDHSRFQSTSSAGEVEGVICSGSNDHAPVGVVDHNDFENTIVLTIGAVDMLSNPIWAEPLGLGTNNAVYVENNSFTGTMAFLQITDANYGGRYVFRYNIVNDSYIEAHSLQGYHRSTRSWEIYNNTLNQVNHGMWIPMFLRGGTGVVFNNIITGYWSGDGFALDNVRSFTDLSFPPGRCNGISLWDGNAQANGYPCRDQIGRSTDQWLWTDSSPYPPQALDPAYFWNNKKGDGSDIVPFIHNGVNAWIVENRDYYVGTSKPGYIPYTYPHPLTLIN